MDTIRKQNQLNQLPPGFITFLHHSACRIEHSESSSSKHFGFYVSSESSGDRGGKERLENAIPSVSLRDVPNIMQGTNQLCRFTMNIALVFSEHCQISELGISKRIYMSPCLASCSFKKMEIGKGGKKHFDAVNRKKEVPSSADYLCG